MSLGRQGAAVPTMALGPFIIALLIQALAGFALGFAVYVLFSTIQSAGEYCARPGPERTQRTAITTSPETAHSAAASPVASRR